MSRPRVDVHVLPTGAEASRAAAAHVAEVALGAVAQRGTFSLAVSGGRSPWLMLSSLGVHAMPWEQTTVFQVDERIAPDGDPRRNLAGLLHALPAAGRGRVVPMPVEGDVAASCLAYAAALPRHLDLVHLGLGADGHTASLVPDDPVLSVLGRDVALTGRYQGARRMTLTYPPIDRARAVLWLVTGEDKRAALDRLRSGDRSIPAGRVATAEQVLICDRAAWGP